MSRKQQIWKTPVCIILAVCAVIALVRHFHIKNFKVVVPDVLYTCGQPRGMDYTRLLYKYHIGTFVNIRSHQEHREENWYNEERVWVGRNGVNYVEMPIERTDRNEQFPDVETQERFLELMADASNHPVIVHGSSGKKRVSMLVSVWLIKEKGYGVEDAVEVVERIKEAQITVEEKKFIRELFTARR